MRVYTFQATSDELNALNEAVKQLPSVSALRSLRDKVLGHTQLKQLNEATFESPLTPYGLLVRALRIVSGTTLLDMSKALSLAPSELSAFEFGRSPVSDVLVNSTSVFFSSLGVPHTLPVLQAAALKSREEQQQA